MGRSIDENLWNSWRQRLARYERWTGTVAAFCDREGVPLATFYQWRRKLGVEGNMSRPAQRRGPAAPDVAPRFLPVRIEAPEPIEIDLPNGVRVRVPLGVARTLEGVLAAAARCDLGVSAEEARAC